MQIKGTNGAGSKVTFTENFDPDSAASVTTCTHHLTVPTGLSLNSTLLVQSTGTEKQHVQFIHYSFNLQM